MKSKGLIISTVMTALLCLASINTAYAEETYKANRLGGQDRIETSVKIATNYNDGQLQAVVVTTANDFPEALTGSTLAAKCKAPILLVNQTAQNSQGTLAYIKGHLSSNGTVYILGQTTSVSTDVENAIRNMGYTNIKRLAGTNKEETLKIINNEVNVSTGTPVFIASGDNFPDALSASGIAAIKGYPIILCSHGVLPQTAIDQLQAVKPSQVYIAGGSAVVPDSIVNKVMGTTGLTSDKIVRLYGQDRYATSLAINKYFNLTTANAVIASGENFPDALAGSSLAAKHNAPIILTDGKFITDGNNIVAHKKYLYSINCSSLIILGGEGSVSKSVADMLSENEKITFYITESKIENNKKYITGYFDRFVYSSDPDALDVARKYDPKVISNDGGKECILDEGFDVPISDPNGLVTLEVDDNVKVNMLNVRGPGDTWIIKDFNTIINHEYHISPYFRITLKNGIVTEMYEALRGA